MLRALVSMLLLLLLLLLMLKLLLWSICFYFLDQELISSRYLSCSWCSCCSCWDDLFKKGIRLRRFKMDQGRKFAGILLK